MCNVKVFVGIPRIFNNNFFRESGHEKVNHKLINVLSSLPAMSLATHKTNLHRMIQLRNGFLMILQIYTIQFECCRCW